MLQRKRQEYTLGPTNSLHQKHANCGDTTTLRWVEVSCRCASHFFLILILEIGQAYVQRAAENGKDGIFTGEERREKRTLSNKILGEKKSQLKKHIESFPGVKSHYSRKGTDKKIPRLQFARQLNVQSGCWKRNEQGVPAGVQQLLPAHIHYRL